LCCKTKVQMHLVVKVVVWDGQGVRPSIGVKFDTYQNDAASW
jgi:hypothetical protein